MDYITCKSESYTEEKEKEWLKMVKELEERTAKKKEKSVTETIEKVCDKLCKYADTVDDNCECEYIRKKKRLLSTG